MRCVVIVESTVDHDVENADVSSVHGPFKTWEQAEHFRARLQVHLDKWMTDTQAVNDSDPEHFGSGSALAHASIRVLDQGVIKVAIDSLPTDD